MFSLHWFAVATGIALMPLVVAGCSSDDRAGAGGSGGVGAFSCQAWDEACSVDGAYLDHCEQMCGSGSELTDALCAQAKCSVETGVCGKQPGEQELIEKCVDSHGWAGAASSSGTTSASTSASATGSSSSGAMMCDGSGDCASCNNCSKYGDGPCAAALAACTADPMCDGYRTCINAQQPADACAESYPGGEAPYQALIACICGACASDCSGSTLCP